MTDGEIAKVDGSEGKIRGRKIHYHHNENQMVGMAVRVETAHTTGYSRKETQMMIQVRGER
jgi:hypothetical protein